jgi:hypothetical protein
MSDEHEQQGQTETEGDETLSDLDISTDDAEKVKGGRASDPCEGGEITR